MVSLNDIASGLVWVDEDRAKAAASQLAAAGWQTGIVDLSDAADRVTQISLIAAALNFPDWTGRNLDALYDSLTDLSWADEPHTALVLTVPTGNNSDRWRHVRAVVIDAVDWWSDKDRNLVVFLVNRPSANPETAAPST